MKTNCFNRAAALLLCAALFATDCAALVPPADALPAPQETVQTAETAAPENAAPATPETPAAAVPAAAETPAPETAGSPEPAAVPASPETPAAPQMSAPPETAGLPAGDAAPAEDDAAEIDAAQPLPQAEPAAEVPVDEATFPDDVFRQYVLDEIDKNGSRTLSADEIEAVREITYRQPGIVSMAGIETFYNLQTLDISAEELMPGWAYDDNTVETLDLSQNTALTTLKCAYNPLTELDLRQNTQLTYLDCHCDEDLSALRIGKNTNLTYLDCRLNYMEGTLDLSGCTALREVQAGQMMCLDTLDLGGCAALETLDCNNCVELETLRLAGCAALTKLRIIDTALTHLDLSTCDALTNVDVCGEDGYVEDIRIRIVPQWSSAEQAWKVDITPLVGAGDLENVGEVYWAANKSHPNINEAADYDRATGIVTTKTTPWEYTLGQSADLYYSYPTGKEGFDLRVKVNCKFSDVQNDISANGWTVTLGGEGISGDEEQGYTAVFTGEAIVPTVTVKPTGKVYFGPKEGTDYIVTCTDNVDVGTATVTLENIGKTYSGTVVKTFAITPRDLSQGEDVSVTAKDAAFNGTVQAPAVTVEWQGRSLDPATDFTLEPASFSDAGTHPFAVNFTGNYCGSVSGTFTVKPLDLSGLAVTLPAKEYTGGGVEQAFAASPDDSAANGYVIPTLKVGDDPAHPLYLGQDYTVTYKNNTAVGTATVTLEGIKNYTGKAEKTFRIDAQTMHSESEGSAGSRIRVVVADNINGAELIYNGKAYTPAVTVYDLAVSDSVPLTKGKDYTVAYKDNTNAGDAASPAPPTVVIKGAGRYRGSFNVPFTIKPCPVDKEIKTYSATAAASTFDGTEKTGKTAPVTTVKYNGKTLTAGKDYTVTEKNGAVLENAGDYTLAIHFTGNYTDKEGTEYTCPYKINPLSIKALAVTLPNKTYTGQAVRQSFAQNQAQSTEKTADGKSDLYVTPTLKLSSTDTKHPLYLCTGEDDPTGDYTVTYKDTADYKVGTVTVTFTGKNNYTGSVNKTFKITAKPLTDEDISKALTGLTKIAAEQIATEGSTPYTAKVITPAEELKLSKNTAGTTEDVKLVKGTDYTVSYANNTNVTADNAAQNKLPAVTFTGKGNYSGKATLYFRIGKRDLATAGENELSIVPKALTYNGTVQTPGFTVKYNGKTLDAKKDYEVKAADGKTWQDAGTYKVLLKALGSSTSYAGEVQAEFTIKPYDIARASIPAIAAKGGFNLTYDGSEKKPVFKGDVTGDAENEDARLNDTDTAQSAVTINPGKVKETLTEGVDYALGYLNNTNAGTATVVLQGIGNYTGMATRTFKIAAYKVTGSDTVSIALAPAMYNGGKALTPAVTSVTVNGKPLEAAWYTAKYANNKNAAEAGAPKNPPTVTLTFKGNYSGTAKQAFTIAPKPLDRVEVTGAALFKKAGTLVKPSIQVYDADGNKVSSGGYTAEYTSDNNWNEGSKCTVTVTGKGNYTTKQAQETGEAAEKPLTAKYTVTRALSSARITYTSKIPYFGEPLTDANLAGKVGLKITVNNAELKQVAADSGENGYVLAVNENKGDKGTVKFTISGSGQYSGSVSKSVSITALPLNKVPGLADTIVLTLGEGDSIVTLSEAVYTGSKIEPTEKVALPEVEADSTGMPVSLSGEVLTRNTDYTIALSANINASAKAAVKITGKGNYSGSVTKYFTIRKLDLGADDVTVNVANLGYTSALALSKASPKVTVTVKGTDGKDYTLPGGAYTVAYDRRTWAEGGHPVGTVKITAKGTNTEPNKTAADTEGFRIGYDLSKATVKELRASAVYGDLKDGTYKTGADGGIAAALEKTKGTPVTFTLGGKTVTLEQLVEAGGTVTLCNTGKKGTAKVVFSAGDDLLTVGTAENELKVVGEISKNISITARPLNTLNAAAKLLLADAEGNNSEMAKPDKVHYGTTYTAAAVKPTVELKDDRIPVDGSSYKLVEKTDYTLSWKNNTNAAAYNKAKTPPTVVITGKGNYSGSVSVYFTIEPAELTEDMVADVTDAVYTGKAVKPAVTAYGVNGKKLSAGSTTYKVEYYDGAPDSTKPDAKDVQAINMGMAHVKVSGQGNYRGSVEKEFYIGYNIAKATYPALKGEYVPDGETVLPDEKLQSDNFVKYKVSNAETLQLHGKDAAGGTKDYEVTYSKNTAAGTAKVTFTAHPESPSNAGKPFVGSVTKNMTVTQVDVSTKPADAFTILLDGEDELETEYTGKALKPTIKVMYGTHEVAAENYTPSYKNNTKLGTATVTLTFKKNYKGKLTTQFEIVLPNNAVAAEP